MRTLGIKQNHSFMVTWLLWSTLSPISRLVLVGSSVWVGDILIIRKPRDPEFNPPHLLMCRSTVQLLLSNSWAYGFCFLQKVYQNYFCAKEFVMSIQTDIPILESGPRCVVLEQLPAGVSWPGWCWVRVHSALSLLTFRGSEISIL